MRFSNKRGAAEGITWVVGLVAIFVIVVFFIGIYSIGNIGKKVAISVDLNKNGDDFYDALTSQRLGAALIVSDFCSSNKGEFLEKIYSSFRIGSVFDDTVELFVKFISYDYYAFVLDNRRLVRGALKDVDTSECDSDNKMGIFYVSSGEDEYSSVSFITRRCEKS